MTAPYQGRHRRTDERAYDLIQSWFQSYVGKHRWPDITPPVAAS